MNNATKLKEPLLERMGIGRWSRRFLFAVLGIIIFVHMLGIGVSGAEVIAEGSPLKGWGLLVMGVIGMSGGILLLLGAITSKETKIVGTQILAPLAGGSYLHVGDMAIKSTL